MHKERNLLNEPRTQQVLDPSPDSSQSPDAVLPEIVASLRGLRFGSVNIIVQDGIVIQIDRTEKRRLKSRSGAD